MCKCGRDESTSKSDAIGRNLLQVRKMSIRRLLKVERMCKSTRPRTNYEIIWSEHVPRNAKALTPTFRYSNRGRSNFANLSTPIECLEWSLLMVPNVFLVPTKSRNDLIDNSCKPKPNRCLTIGWAFRSSKGVHEHLCLGKTRLRPRTLTKLL